MISRAFVWIGVFFGMAIGLEALAAIYFWIAAGQLPYFESPSSAETVDAFHVADAVFHPYTGYVLRATRDGDYLDGTHWRANNRGYHNLVTGDGSSCCDYPYVPAENEVVIGVFGGSVAGGYSLSAQIAGSFAALAEFEPWRGKHIRVLNFGLPGFKQPQQLMSLAYFLHLGQHFDIIINIDGFNEAVTTFRNWQSGVEPTYPADSLWGAWGRQLEQYDLPPSDGRFFLAGYHRLAARSAQRAARETRVASLRLFRQALSAWHAQRAAANEAAVLPALTKRVYFPTQVRSALPAESDIWRYTATHWQQASRAMAVLAKQAGATYIHLLQPNQWDRASGEYAPVAADHPYDWVIMPVNQTYPLFREGGQWLRGQGVRFIDLSRQLAELPNRMVYADDCCHYTQAGNELLLGATIEALKANR